MKAFWDCDRGIFSENQRVIFYFYTQVIRHFQSQTRNKIDSLQIKGPGVKNFTGCMHALSHSLLDVPSRVK